MIRLNPLNRIRSALATLLAALIVGSTLLSPARPADSNTLQAIDVRPMAGQQLQLTLKLSGPAPTPNSFTIDDPARISVDLPGTTLALASRRIDVRSGGLDNIVITLGQVAGQAAVAGATPASSDGAAPTTVGVRSIEGIDFRRSVDGA